MKLHGVNSLWDGGVVNALVGPKGTSIELCSEEVVEERDDIANSMKSFASSMSCLDFGMSQ